MTLTTDCFDHLVISASSYYISEEFNNIVHRMFELLSTNAKENQSLVQIRDALLPKLMSRAVRVTYN